LRDEEAKTALFAQQSLSTRLYDLIDSKLGGSQDGSTPGNDESALFLASRHPDIFPRAKVQPKYVNLSPASSALGQTSSDRNIAFARIMARTQKADELGAAYTLYSGSRMGRDVKAFTKLARIPQEGELGRPKGSRNRVKLEPELAAALSGRRGL
jgi:hypothetical protein